MKALKCSLCDLLWLTLLAALLTAWGLDHRQEQAKIEGLSESLAQFETLFPAGCGVRNTSGWLISQTPPPVDGIITSIDEAGGLVEISLGKDDGLQKGSVFEVYRGAQFIGEIVIREAGPDKAVGEIVRKTQRGRFKSGDRVTTKFQRQPR